MFLSIHILDKTGIISILAIFQCYLFPKENHLQLNVSLKAYFVLGPSDLNMVSLKETAQNINE